MYIINKAMIFARKAQQAYNAALAVTAALSGNWIALAAAAAVGGTALYLISQQEDYNKELEKTQKLSEGMKGAAIPMPPGKTQAAAAAGATGVKAGASAPKSSASKPTTINITIGKLIETQVVKVAQASADFKQKVSSAVTEALLTTLNDSQRIAAQ
jgi:hypothetical protein